MELYVNVNYILALTQFIIFLFLLICSCAQYEPMPNCPKEEMKEVYNVFNGYYDLDIDKALACSAETGRPILIVFDCWACIGYPPAVWEVLELKSVSRLISDQFIILVLMTDDRMLLKESYTSCFRDKEKIIKTIGQKNSDFQRTQFNSNTQPLYAIIDHKFNHLTSPKGYTPVKDKNKFLDFLKEGLGNTGKE